MLSHAIRPRCANWNGTSESVPPCDYSPAPSRTVGYVDIFLSAHPGPLRPCRSPLGTLLLVPSESPRVAAVAAFHATCARSALPSDSPRRTHFRPPGLARLRWHHGPGSDLTRWLHGKARRQSAYDFLAPTPPPN